MQICAFWSLSITMKLCLVVVKQQKQKLPAEERLQRRKREALEAKAPKAAKEKAEKSREN